MRIANMEFSILNQATMKVLMDSRQNMLLKKCIKKMESS